MKSKAAYYIERRGKAGSRLKPMEVPDLEKYKYIQLQEDISFDAAQEEKRRVIEGGAINRSQDFIIKEESEERSRISRNKSNDPESP